LETTGTRTREAKSCSSSCSRRFGASDATPLGPITWVSSKRTARCFSARPWSMYTPTRMIESPSDSTERISQISAIDIHDRLHPEDPEHEQDQRDDDHDDPVDRLEQDPDVFGVD